MPGVFFYNLKLNHYPIMRASLSINDFASLEQLLLLYIAVVLLTLTLTVQAGNKLALWPRVIEG